VFGAAATGDAVGVSVVSTGTASTHTTPALIREKSRLIVPEYPRALADSGHLPPTPDRANPRGFTTRGVADRR
jgi:hypothetical protein